MLRQNNKTIAIIQKSLDVLCIVLLFLLSCAIWDVDFHNSRMALALLTCVALFLFFASTFDLYRSWRVHSLWEEFHVVFYTLCCTMLGMLLLAYASKTSSNYSRLTILSWWLMLPFGLMTIRAVVRGILKHLREKGYNTRTVGIVGTGRAAQELAMEIQRNEWMGLKIAGYYDDRQSFRELVEGAPQLPIKGIFDDLIREARNNKLDEVYVALPAKAEDIMARIVNALADCAVPVHIVPDYFTFKLLTARTSNVGHIPVVSVYELPMDDLGAILKRLLDVVASLIILAIIALPMLLIAIAIKLTSPGPVLFKQRRYGMRGEVIEVWKFRSMTVMEDGPDVPQAQKNDPRITRLGAFLRRTSLDELPQFFNVLQGSMSIVGPRPHAIAHNEQYRKRIEGYMLRHLVKPGITGWAQVNGWRGETDTDEKMRMRVQYDLEYLQNWSIWLDIKIILLTVFKGFIGKNAY
jgi:putative colanic acid biosynthesis UDP-glucose lipid carrier transferase